MKEVAKKRVRNKVGCISDPVLEGCDVKLGTGLFPEHTYFVKYKNVQFRDVLKIKRTYRKGKAIVGSKSKQVYLDSIEVLVDATRKDRKKVDDIYLLNMKKCKYHWLRMYLIYYAARLKSFKECF